MYLPILVRKLYDFSVFEGTYDNLISTAEPSLVCKAPKITTIVSTCPNMAHLVNFTNPRITVASEVFNANFVSVRHLFDCEDECVIEAVPHKKSNVVEVCIREHSANIDPKEKLSAFRHPVMTDLMSILPDPAVGHSFHISDAPRGISIQEYIQRLQENSRIPWDERQMKVRRSVHFVMTKLLSLLIAVKKEHLYLHRLNNNAFILIVANDEVVDFKIRRNFLSTKEDSFKANLLVVAHLFSSAYANLKRLLPIEQPFFEACLPMAEVTLEQLLDLPYIHSDPMTWDPEDSLSMSSGSQCSDWDVVEKDSDVSSVGEMILPHEVEGIAADGTNMGDIVSSDDDSFFQIEESGIRTTDDDTWSVHTAIEPDEESALAEDLEDDTQSESSNESFDHIDDSESVSTAIEPHSEVVSTAVEESEDETQSESSNESFAHIDDSKSVGKAVESDSEDDTKSESSNESYDHVDDTESVSAAVELEESLEAEQYEIDESESEDIESSEDESLYTVKSGFDSDDDDACSVSTDIESRITVTPMSEKDKEEFFKLISDVVNKRKRVDNHPETAWSKVFFEIANAADVESTTKTVQFDENGTGCKSANCTACYAPYCCLTGDCNICRGMFVPETYTPKSDCAWKHWQQNHAVSSTHKDEKSCDVVANTVDVESTTKTVQVTENVSGCKTPNCTACYAPYDYCLTGNCSICRGMFVSETYTPKSDCAFKHWQQNHVKSPAESADENIAADVIKSESEEVNSSVSPVAAATEPEQTVITLNGPTCTKILRCIDEVIMNVADRDPKVAADAKRFYEFLNAAHCNAEFDTQLTTVSSMTETVAEQSENEKSTVAETADNKSVINDDVDDVESEYESAASDNDSYASAHEDAESDSSDEGDDADVTLAGAVNEEADLEEEIKNIRADFDESDKTDSEWDSEDDISEDENPTDSDEEAIEDEIEANSDKELSEDETQADSDEAAIKDEFHAGSEEELSEDETQADSDEEAIKDEIHAGSEEEISTDETQVDSDEELSEDETQVDSDEENDEDQRQVDAVVDSIKEEIFDVSSDQPTVSTASESQKESTPATCTNCCFLPSTKIIKVSDLCALKEIEHCNCCDTEATVAPINDLREYLFYLTKMRTDYPRFALRNLGFTFKTSFDLTDAKIIVDDEHQTTYSTYENGRERFTMKINFNGPNVASVIWAGVTYTDNSQFPPIVSNNFMKLQVVLEAIYVQQFSLVVYFKHLDAEFAIHHDSLLQITCKDGIKFNDFASQLSGDKNFAKLIEDERYATAFKMFMKCPMNPEYKYLEISM
uniref:Protein kinase domain-containing protein n=1 Tax=Panagrellus redivivus TaxID=6233 RepID=A0A7E4VUQ1_PANRE